MEKKYNKNELFPEQSSGLNNGTETRHKLFIGGLPPDITEAEFSYFFGQFGPLYESLLVRNRDTGKSRGFGFIVVDSDVSKLLLSTGNNGDGIGRQCIRGKTVEIKTASPKPKVCSHFRKSIPKPDYKKNQFETPAYSHSNEPMYVPFLNQNYNYPVFYPQGENAAGSIIPGYNVPMISAAYFAYHNVGNGVVNEGLASFPCVYLPPQQVTSDYQPSQYFSVPSYVNQSITEDQTKITPHWDSKSEQ